MCTALYLSSLALSLSNNKSTANSRILAEEISVVLAEAEKVETPKTSEIAEKTEKPVDKAELPVAPPTETKTPESKPAPLITETPEKKPDETPAENTKEVTPVPAEATKSDDVKPEVTAVPVSEPVTVAPKEDSKTETPAKETKPENVKPEVAAAPVSEPVTATPKEDSKTEPATSTIEKISDALPGFTGYFLYFFGAFILILLAGTCGVMMLSSFYKRQIESFKQAPFQVPDWAPKSLFPRDHSFYWEHEITLTDNHVNKPISEDLMQQLN